MRSASRSTTRSSCLPARPKRTPSPVSLRYGVLSWPSGNSDVCLYGAAISARAVMGMVGFATDAAVLGRFPRHGKPPPQRPQSQSRPRLDVEFLEVTVDAPLAERNAARRGEIGGDPRSLGHTLVQRNE